MNRPLSIFNIHYSILSHRYKVKYVQLSTYHIQYSILSHRYQVNHIHIPYDDGSICVTTHNYAASKTKANQIITKEFTEMPNAAGIKTFSATLHDMGVPWVEFL